MIRYKVVKTTDNKFIGTIVEVQDNQCACEFLEGLLHRDLDIVYEDELKLVVRNVHSLVVLKKL